MLFSFDSQFDSVDFVFIWSQNEALKVRIIRTQSQHQLHM